MPWVYKKEGVPEFHDHPLKLPKKVRDALAPLQLVSRKQWGALPNNDEEPMELPIKYVRHVQTYTDPCNSKEECVKLMRKLQTEHMREGMPDINWNFIIGGDGRVYEGRGWELDSTRDYERWAPVEAECLDVAYVGKFHERGLDIPEFMKKQAEALTVFGVDKKFIHCCYELIEFDLETNP